MPVFFLSCCIFCVRRQPLGVFRTGSFTGRQSLASHAMNASVCKRKGKRCLPGAFRKRKRQVGQNFRAVEKEAMRGLFSGWRSPFGHALAFSKAVFYPAFRKSIRKISGKAGPAGTAFPERKGVFHAVRLKAPLLSPDFAVLARSAGAFLPGCRSGGQGNAASVTPNRPSLFF